MGVGACGFGGGRRTRLRASERPKCKKKRRFKYTGPIFSAISSVIVARGNARRCEEVATARSYKSWEAASAYSSIGNSGAWLNRTEKSGVEGAMRTFGGMPYAGKRFTAVTRAGKEGE